MRKRTYRFRHASQIARHRRERSACRSHDAAMSTFAFSRGVSPSHSVKASGGKSQSGRGFCFGLPNGERGVDPEDNDDDDDDCCCGCGSFAGAAPNDVFDSCECPAPLPLPLVDLSALLSLLKGVKPKRDSALLSARSGGGGDPGAAVLGAAPMSATARRNPANAKRRIFFFCTAYWQISR